MSLLPAPSQSGLFDELPIPHDRLPDGLRLQEGFLSLDEEAHLLTVVASLPLEAARYKQYTARRQVISYGGSFDYDTNRLEPSQPLIDALHPLRDRVAHWAGVPPQSLVHTLVAAYAPGTPLGWHRDVPQFEKVFGVSLGGPATLRFRPYPHDARTSQAEPDALDALDARHIGSPRARRGTPNLGDAPDLGDTPDLWEMPEKRHTPPAHVAPRRQDILRLQVEPRAIYAITGAARWEWQHSVAPVDQMRWSITFRTARQTRYARPARQDGQGR